jgi:hypothetical protein
MHTIFHGRWVVIAIGILGAMLLAGCGAEAAPEPTITSPPPAVTSAPTDPPVTEQVAPANSPTPALTSTPQGPWLAPVIGFAASPDAEPTGLFASGTQEIFALITYGNMSEGMVFRREWYLDGELWLEREEKWDFARYGASGTLTDISIHDFDKGLPVGRYELLLYIDGVRQNPWSDSADRIFAIRYRSAALDGPITSPDGSTVLAVEPPDRIVMQQPDGASKTLVEADWIQDVVWFPDSAHFAYTNMIGEPDAYWFRIDYETWIFNVADGTGWPIEHPEYDVPVRAPLISPDGRKLAVIMGDGYGDACGVGIWAMIVVLDEAYKPVEFIGREKFSGLPTEGYEAVYVPYSDQSGWAVGEWVDSSTLLMDLAFTCTTTDLDGTFAFNLDTLTASRR